MIAALLLSIMIIIARPLGKMDRVWSDIALSSQKTPASSEYLIVDITLEDTKRFGGLPLSRAVLAKALDKLNQAGGAQILVDMTLSDRLASGDDVQLVNAMSKWGPERLAIGDNSDSIFAAHATVVELGLQPDADGWTRAVRLPSKASGLNPSRWLATGEQSPDMVMIDQRIDPSTLTRISLSQVLEGQALNAANKRIVLGLNSETVPTRLHLPMADTTGRAPVIALGSQSARDGFQARFSKAWKVSILIALCFTMLGIVFAQVINTKRILFLTCFIMSILAVIANIMMIKSWGGHGHPALQYSCLLIGVFVSITYRLRLIQMLVSFFKGDLSPEEAWAWRSHEHSNFPVILFNAMGSIRRTNAAAAEIEPWLDEGFLHRSMSELRNGSHVISVVDEYGSVRDLSIERPNEEVPILILRDVTETARKFDALEAKSRSLENAVTTLRVSETRAIELAQTLEQKQFLAEEKSKLKSEFLASMSHELRTPLNAINGFSDIMQKELFGPLGDPRYKQFASDILFSGQHLLSLINDILDLSKIEAGKMALNLEPVNLDDVIGQSIRMLALRAKQAGLHLTYPSIPLPQVMADPRAIKQIIVNLLTNAVKFTPQGGVVQVKTEMRATDIVVHISDSGIGISEEDVKRLGQPFEQVKNEETNKQEGTGLGLSLSKSMVELHGGQFQITSLLGRGTTISFTVPYQQAGQNIVQMKGQPAPQVQYGQAV